MTGAKQWEPPTLDLDSLRGMEWGQWNATVAARYSGEWLVARPGEVIAHGPDPDAVRAEAAAKTGIPGHQLAVFAVAHPDTWGL